MLLATISYGQKSEKLAQQIEQMVSEFIQVFLSPENSTMDKFPWLKYIPFMKRYFYKAREINHEMSKHLLEDLRQRLKEKEKENNFVVHILKNMNVSSDIFTKLHE